MKEQIPRIAPVARIYKLGEEPSHIEYWRSRPFSERLEQFFEIRSQYNLWKYGNAEPRLERVYQSLNKNRVRYLVVGGLAVAFHGHPRYTKDIDLWIAATRPNAQRLVDALKEFGFESLGLEIPHFLKSDQIVQLGYPPSRIDLLTSIPGVDFANCYRAKVVVTIQGVSVNFIDLKNLVKNKRASGRQQDLADLEHLERSSKPKTKARNLQRKKQNRK